MVSNALLSKRAVFAGMAIVSVLVGGVFISAKKWRSNRFGELVPREKFLIWENEADPMAAGSLPASVQFVLTNVGKVPVTITGVESSCGCAKPVVTPNLVEPGRTATVDVVATAIPVGEKNVPITIQTDSSVTPHVELVLRLIGNRKPPFLFKTMGDLTFRGKYPIKDTRTFTVITIENVNEKTEPEIQCDLPFLKITQASRTDKPYRVEDVVMRYRTYTVSFMEKPDADSFFGRVAVSDPWDKRTHIDVNIIGQLQSSRIKSVPATIQLDKSLSTSRVLIITDEPTAQIDFKVEGEPDFLLDVREEKRTGLNKVHVLIVSSSATAIPEPRRSNLKVRSPGIDEELLVPITLGLNRP